LASCAGRARGRPTAPRCCPFLPQSRFCLSSGAFLWLWLGQGLGLGLRFSAIEGVRRDARRVDRRLLAAVPSCRNHGSVCHQVCVCVCLCVWTGLGIGALGGEGVRREGAPTALHCSPFLPQSRFCQSSGAFLWLWLGRARGLGLCLSAIEGVRHDARGIDRRLFAAFPSGRNHDSVCHQVRFCGSSVGFAQGLGREREASTDGTCADYC
jgi:hypothetical protein